MVWKEIVVRFIDRKVGNARKGRLAVKVIRPRPEPVTDTVCRGPRPPYVGGAVPLRHHSTSTLQINHVHYRHVFFHHVTIFRHLLFIFVAYQSFLNEKLIRLNEC